jgi:hypothetical protein
MSPDGLLRRAETDLAAAGKGLAGSLTPQPHSSLAPRREPWLPLLLLLLGRLLPDQGPSQRGRST